MSTTTAPNPMKAVEFLASLPGQFIDLTAINPKTGIISGRSYAKGNAGDRAACAKAIETATARGAGLYFNINGLSVRLGIDKRPDGKSIPKAKEADVNVLHSLHVDADVDKSITDPAAFAAAKADLLTAIQAMNKPPTIIIDSGNGFGLFWLLRKPVKVTDQNRDTLKGINIALRDMVRGLPGGSADACQNLDRVMRVPFTTNYPNAAKLKRGRVEVTTSLISDDRERLYAVEDFEAAPVEEPNSDSSSNMDEAIDIPFAVDMSIFDGPFYKLIVKGPGDKKFGTAGTRSEYVFYVICSLIEGGVPDGDIVWIVTNRDFAVSEHVLQQKQRGTPERQALHMIRDAKKAGARYIGPDEDFGRDPDVLTPEEQRVSDEWADINARTKPKDYGDRKQVWIVTGKLVKAMEEVQRIVGKQTDRPDPIFKRRDRLARLSRNLTEPGIKFKHFEKDALIILDITKHWMATRLEKSIEFVIPDGKDKATGKWILKPINCPLGLVDRILGDSTNWNGYPTLHATVETPTLRADGTILDQPGYDRSTGLFYDPADVKFPPIENLPTIEQGKVAMQMIDNLLVDFPFDPKNTDAKGKNISKAVALSLLMSSVVRRTMDIAPIYGVDADEAEAGKTTLVKVGGALATGRDIEVQAYASNVEERDKLLPGLLLSGSPYIAFDNLPDGCIIEGAEIEKVVTSAFYASRPFGKNDVVRTMPTNATMVFNGNKIGAGGTMPTRMLIVRLVPTAPLAERKFEHPDIVAYTIKHRPMLVAAILTALRCYLVHGTEVEKDRDRFPQWSKLIRSALMWYGHADPLRGGDALRRDDPTKEAQRQVLRQWWIKFRDAPMLARDLARDAEVKDVLAEGLNIRPADVNGIRTGRYIDKIINVRLGLPVEVIVQDAGVKHARKYRLQLKPSGREDWAKTEETEPEFEDA